MAQVMANVVPRELQLYRSPLYPDQNSASKAYREGKDSALIGSLQQSIDQQEL